MKRSYLSLLVLLVLLGCGSFAYEYYGIDWAEKTEDVVLFDPNRKLDDISFVDCKPTPQESGKCVVIKREEFFKIRRDMETMRARIKELEKACNIKP